MAADDTSVMSKQDRDTRIQSAHDMFITTYESILPYGPEDSENADAGEVRGFAEEAWDPVKIELPAEYKNKFKQCKTAPCQEAGHFCTLNVSRTLTHKHGCSKGCCLEICPRHSQANDPRCNLTLNMNRTHASPDHRCKLCCQMFCPNHPTRVCVLLATSSEHGCVELVQKTCPVCNQSVTLRCADKPNATGCGQSWSRKCHQCDLKFTTNCGPNQTSQCGCTRTKVAVKKRHVGANCKTGDNHNKTELKERTHHTLTVECDPGEFLENHSSIQLGDTGDKADGQTIPLAHWDSHYQDIARGPTKVSISFYGGSHPHFRTISANVMHWQYRYHWPAHLNRPDEDRDK